MTVIELDKLGDILEKQTDDMTPLEMWLIFLRYADDVKKRDLINKILTQREAVSTSLYALKTVGVGGMMNSLPMKLSIV